MVTDALLARCRRALARLRGLPPTARVRSATALVVVPLVVAVITLLSDAVETLSFLLFPPLAAATHRLFAHPGEGSASPLGVVLGLTAGALGGWTAVAVGYPVFGHPAGTFAVSVPTAVLSVVFTGLLLRALDIDLSPAFALSLLVPLLDAPPAAFVASVVVASSIVAVAFLGWQRLLHDRAER